MKWGIHVGAALVLLAFSPVLRTVDLAVAAAILAGLVVIDLIQSRRR